jgi:prephenate dehydratase
MMRKRRHDHAQFSPTRPRPGRDDDQPRPRRTGARRGVPGRARLQRHRAALEYDPHCLPLPCFSFEDALDAVKEGRAARAIIPIENSQHGRVADIHFLLPESGLAIVGEYFLPITTR